MAIESRDFGLLRLTGEDAKRFIRHLNEDKPNPLAQASLDAGRKMIRDSGRDGCVFFSLKMKQKK